MTDSSLPIGRVAEAAAAAQTAPTARSTSDPAFSNLFRKASGSGAAQKAADMDDIFTRAASQYGISENLLKAVAKAESGFDPSSVSRAGAQGVMQLMPSTAASMGVADPLDAEQNIMGGARYLSQKISQYNGDVKLALAAYNAGSGNVAKYGGIPPFKETQTYVKRVLDYAGMEPDAPKISAEKLPDSLSALNASGSLNALSLLAGGSASGLSALSGLDGSGALSSLSSLLAAAKSGSPGTSAYSYDDYIAFFQLLIAQMQQNVTQSLTSGLTADSTDFTSGTLL